MQSDSRDHAFFGNFRGGQVQISCHLRCDGPAQKGGLACCYAFAIDYLVYYEYPSYLMVLMGYSTQVAKIMEPLYLFVESVVS